MAELDLNLFFRSFFDLFLFNCLSADDYICASICSSSVFFEDTSLGPPFMERSRSGAAPSLWMTPLPLLLIFTFWMPAIPFDLFAV
jgi:hypothetical protein